jgi:hypothetical protein
MRRSPGVTFSAVVLLLGAVLLLWSVIQTAVALMSTSGAIQVTAAARNSLSVSAVLLFLLAAWCGATAIGLALLAPWARRSMLALSLLLAVASLATAAMLAFYLRPGNPVSAAIAVGPVAQGALLFFYSVLALLGLWWVYLFSKKHIKAQFEKSPEVR